jgi:hypothetical protein
MYCDQVSHGARLLNYVLFTAAMMFGNFLHLSLPDTRIIIP